MIIITVLLAASELTLGILFGQKHHTLKECEDVTPLPADAEWLAQAKTVANFEMFIWLSGFFVTVIAAITYYYNAYPSSPRSPSWVLSTVFQTSLVFMGLGPLVISMKELFAKTAACPTEFSTNLDTIGLYLIFAITGAVMAVAMAGYGYWMPTPTSSRAVYRR